MKNLKPKIGTSKIKILTLSMILSIMLGVIEACKKNSSDMPTRQDPSVTSPTPQNPEILFDYKDAAPMSFVIQGKWNKTNLTWYVEKWCNTLSQSDTRLILKKALAAWSDVSTLTFSEVGSISQADIVILFGDNNHFTSVNNSWCPYNFNVVWKNTGTLAHTYNPPPNGPLAGDLHFCDLHKWSPYGETNGASISLLSVAIHEIGHAIGIDHSSDAQAIMYAYYNFQNIKSTLSKDDITAVQFLYKPGNTLNSIIRITGMCPASVKVNTSQSFSMTIINDGNRPLQVTDINITNNSGVFSFLNGKPNLPISIPPSGKIDIGLKFSPTSAIQYNSTLIITSDAASGDNTSSLVAVGEANLPQISNSTLTDFRDNKVYKVIKIGNQTWMAEDLNFNSPNSISYNGSRFYDFNTAIQTAPAGWHLPTDEEWQTLEIYLGMSNSEAKIDGQRGTNQGNQISVGGSSGLNLDFKGSGVLNYSNGSISFTGVGQIGGFWTATKNWIGGGVNSYSAKTRSVNKSLPSKIYRANSAVTGNYFLVRCVKD